MRLYATFLIFNFQLSHTFAFPQNPLELSSQANRNPKGYECGNYFFTENEVKEALSLARPSIDKEYQYPQRYQGELYSDSRLKEYFIYPITNGPQFLPYMKHTYSVFYIVLTRNSDEEVDVVAKITNDDYTKCYRRDGIHNGPSHSVPKNPNGYLCGHKFFTDETIKKSLSLAQTNVDENTKYFSPYVGRLYSENSDYLKLPIITRDNLDISWADKNGPYFLILNKKKQFIDVVVRGNNYNFLRCIRSRKPPESSASDPFTKLLVPPPKPGYLCNKVFFEDEILKENAERVKNEARNANRGKHPIEYSGPPFNERCLTWPLLQDGSLSRRGSKGPYHLILTIDYKVFTVAMFSRGRYKACERHIVRHKVRAKKNHDTSDYDCNERDFSHLQLVIAAKEACLKLKTVTDEMYPARYQGPRFMLDGPYFTYPVFRNDVVREFRFIAGLHRVVINTKCEVVGALTTLKVVPNGDLNNRIRKKLVKCHRLDDGPLPSGFFDANAETVFEHKVKH